MTDRIASGPGAHPAGAARLPTLREAFPLPTEPPRSAPFPLFTESADRLIHAYQGRFTLGLSPASLLLAYLDWLVHLGNSPAKCGELAQNALAKAMPLAVYAANSLLGRETPYPFAPLPQDRRFTSSGWAKWPFSAFSQSFLYIEQWWHYATTGIRGVSGHHLRVVEFAGRQLLDTVAPSNFVPTNPEVLKATIDEGGRNLVHGAQNLLADATDALAGRTVQPAPDYLPGKGVALTPGRVVLRNRLIELIQYTPATPKVYAEPILIVPAWIMKYYILDLSPHNSMIRWLVEKGHTVFVISWKNPAAEDRDLGMTDYRRLGINAALETINAIVPGAKVQGVGYCLGGTLLAIAAAAMARDGDSRLGTLTLLAGQTDFEDAGGILLFIDESQVTYIEDLMWDQGYLDTKQMAGAFQMLRSNDLIWSRMVRQYLLGDRDHPNDLMSWNADGTRMPYRMHSEYLRRLFLDNSLSEGTYLVEGRPVALGDIRVPVFAVGTTEDHVAPWRSVYKINLHLDTEVTFVLCNGGHNAGVVSEPGHPRRRYQIATRRALDPYLDPDTWVSAAPVHEGSWWEAWQPWLARHSGAMVEPPPMGAPDHGYPPLADAPGSYVLMG
ncbi:MAG: alpha/beta fold hydrolase [Magnetospirillum sp.]|nr:alpha/beta fold hydrolase [Magnetospirillum sp.]